METIVTTKQGSLEGLLSEDKQTVIFRGVPYCLLYTSDAADE